MKQQLPKVADYYYKKTSRGLALAKQKFQKTISAASSCRIHTNYVSTMTDFSDGNNAGVYCPPAHSSSSDNSSLQQSKHGTKNEVWSRK